MVYTFFMNIVSKSSETIRVERINRQIPIPLYYQIAQHLRGEIRERGLRPGDLLGTEEEIQKKFRVSRATVRKALEELVEEGLVTRLTGKGTYVAKPRLAVQLPALLSFSAEMKRLGMAPSARVIEASLAAPDEEVVIHLMIEDESQVLRLERIRYADDTPMAHTIDYLPTWVGLRPGMDFTGSLYELLDAAGFPPEEAVHTIEGGCADTVLAGYLDVPLGSPVLRCRDTAFDASGRPVIFGFNVWRGDRYSYQVRLKRPAAVCG
jgi:GntR family transcriptional regulator